MGGLTLDTGALIALERTRKRIREIVAAAQVGKDLITVPAAVVAEWWRGPDKRRQLIRAMFDVEPLDEDLAKIAGGGPRVAAQGGDVDGSVTIDAIVIASAARRGDVVFTSDVDDLGRFSRFFPNVRIFRV